MFTFITSPGVHLQKEKHQKLIEESVFFFFLFFLLGGGIFFFPMMIHFYFFAALLICLDFLKSRVDPCPICPSLIVNIKLMSWLRVLTRWRS